jgi:hypothetical protein
MPNVLNIKAIWKLLYKVAYFTQNTQHVEDEADAPEMRENVRDALGARLAGAPGMSVYCSYSEHDCSFSEQHIRYIGSFRLPLSVF